MTIRRPEEISVRNDPQKDISNIEYALWKAWFETPDMSEEELYVIKATDEIQQMQDDVEQLRAELAQQQVHAEAQAARIEELEERGSKVAHELVGAEMKILGLEAQNAKLNAALTAAYFGDLSQARAALAE